MPFRKPQGYARLYKDHGASHRELAFGDTVKPSIERDTFTCGHCQLIIHVHPRQRPEDIGGMCKVCSSLICPECWQILFDKGCIPIMKKIEDAEKKALAISRYEA